MANGYRQNVNVDSGQPETDATNDDNLPMLMLLSLDERFANNDDTEIHPWSPMQFWQRRVLLFGKCLARMTGKRNVTICWTIREERWLGIKTVDGRAANF